MKRKAFFYLPAVLIILVFSACSRPRYYGDQGDHYRRENEERTHAAIVREQQEIIRRQEEEIKRQDLEIEDLRRQKVHNDNLRRFEK